MPVDPREILAEISPDEVIADAPPEVANYRDADLQGVACAFCTKFRPTGTRAVALADGNGEVDVPVGICDQWEANVDGVKVCDRFSSGAPAFDANGAEVWDFADSEKSFSEIHLAASEAQVDEETGFVIKEVLRTGEWPVIPTGKGIVKKPLKIVRDGISSKTDGVIAMEELVANFKAGAIARPQIPLSDDDYDHKNTTRLNTGFVRDLWIEDGEDGEAKLVAKMEFTEPDVKEKVLRGTYADVSAGIPWGIRSRGKEFGAVVEHVAITNRPFIDGLGPFLAASDKDGAEVDVAHFGEIPEEKPPVEEPELRLTEDEIRQRATAALTEQLDLNEMYEVTQVADDTITITNEIAETSWTVPYEIKGTEISVAQIDKWQAVEEEGEESAPPAKEQAPRQLEPLEMAHSLRELRLSQPTGNGSGGSAMPDTGIAALDGLELSDEARAAIQNVLNENASLKARTRESEADARIEELKGLGLEERPGALTFYRQVFLSDDGGPAVVLLSDDGKEKQRLTALEVLDQFIEAIKGSDEDVKIALSDQHLASGNDEKPPVDAGEEAPLADRVAQTREFLTGQK